MINEDVKCFLNKYQVTSLWWWLLPLFQLLVWVSNVTSAQHLAHLFKMVYSSWVRLVKKVSCCKTDRTMGPI